MYDRDEKLKKGGCLMMNKKQCDFFEEVSRRPGSYRTYEELASLLHVSTRSIRNYCAVLSDYAAETGAGVILNLQPSGLIFVGSREQIQCIQSGIRGGGFYSYRLSQKERILAVTLLLLSSEEPVTVTQICERLYVSRATVLSDMEHTREFFRQFAVPMHSTRGYRLEISESQRRDIALTAAFPYLDGWGALGDRTGIMGNLLTDIFQLSTLVEPVIRILQEAENQYGISISDRTFKQAVFTVCLISRRLLDGHILEQYSSGRTLASHSSVQRITRSILLALESQLNLHASEAEAAYLAQRLYDCRFDRPRDFEDSIDIHLYLEIHRFLSDVGKELQCCFTEDQRLLIMLTRHIQGIQSHYTPTGDLLVFEQALVSDNRSCYDAIMHHIGRIEDFLGHTCSHSEVCSILLHVISAVERQNRTEFRPRVCVVCHIGIGTAYYLADRLKETFNLEISNVTSIHRLNEVLEKGDFDLLVSTVPLKMESDRYVRVSPNLGDPDILAIQAALAQLRKVRRAQSKSRQRPAAAHTLSSLIQPEHIVLNVPCTDWQDALRICGTPLLADGAIVPEYIDAIIRSVQSNGPYFVFAPHVALAHAAPTDGVKKFCCSIYRPETPVVFRHPTNDPVALLVLVGITDVKAQIDRISALMNMLANNAILSRILAAHDTDEITAIFSENGITSKED